MNTRIHFPGWGPPLLAVLALTSNAGATTYPAWGPPTAESLEWKLMDADVVVRGRVIAIRDLPDWPPAVRGVATVSVDEVLKGEPVATIECVVFGEVKTEQLPQWQRDGMQGLWLLKTGDDTAVGGLLPPGIRYYVRHNGAAPLARGAGPRLLSVELARWLEPDELLDAARKVFWDRPGQSARAAPCMVTLPVVIPRAPEPDWEVPMLVTCPVDRHLEGLARNWVRSSNPWQRLGGVQGLWHFKSDENIQILKQMLHDRALPQEQGVFKWKRRSSRIAIEAHRILATWGVRGRAPAIVDEVLPHRPVSRPSRWTTAGIVAVVLVLVVGLLRRGRAPRTTFGRALNPRGLLSRRLLNVAAAAMAVACVLSIAMWVRSHSRVDELIVAYGGRNHELSSSPGMIRYWQAAKWPEDRPLSYGSFDASAWSPLFNPSRVRGIEMDSGATTSGLYRVELDGWYRELLFPWWLVVAVTAVLPVGVAAGVIRRWRRLLAVGTCLNCGYDLRASTGRCPECGEAILPHPASAKAPAAG